MSDKYHYSALQPLESEGGETTESGATPAYTNNAVTPLLNTKTSSVIEDLSVPQLEEIEHQLGTIDTKKAADLALVRQQRLATLKALVDEWPASVLRTGFAYIKHKSALYVDVIILTAAFYYLDVFLDVFMMMAFLEHRDILFLCSNLTGIFAGLVYTGYEMTQAIRAKKAASGVDKKLESKSFLLIVGFCIPLQLHVLFLCATSLWEGKKNPLLLVAKLAESIVESTVSAAVQTYALIFRDLPFHEKAVGFVSVGMSYLSIAFAFTSFDRKDKGLSGIPGLSNGWSLGLVCVFICRVCEITSRITSLGLFQMAVRNEGNFDRFGILDVMSVDLVIMFALVFYFQGVKRGVWNNLPHCLPCVICLMNPLLSSENSHSVPHRVYYTVRLLEVCAMGGLAYQYAEWHGTRGDDGDNLLHLDAMRKEFRKDYIAIYACVISTVGWWIMVPIVRFVFAGQVMLTYDVEMFGNERFRSNARVLRDKLLDVVPISNCQEPTKENYAQSVFVVRMHKLCEAVAEDMIGTLQSASQKMVPSKVDLAMSGKLGDSAKDAAGAPLTELDKGFPRTDSVIDVDILRQEAAAAAWLQCPPGKLKVWASKMHDEEKSREENKNELSEIFEKVLMAGANLAPYLQARLTRANCKPYIKSEKDARECYLSRTHAFRQKARYHRLLQQLNFALAHPDPESRRLVCQKLELDSNVKAVTIVIPDWDSWTEHGDQAQELYIFFEKCLLVSTMMSLGWANLGLLFHDRAKDIHRQFDVKPMRLLPTIHISPRLQRGLSLSEKVIHEFILKAQLHTIVEMWKAMPPQIDKKEFFNEKKEIQALLDGAEKLVETREAEIRCCIANEEDKTALFTIISQDLVVIGDMETMSVLNRLKITLFPAAGEGLRIRQFAKGKAGEPKEKLSFLTVKSDMELRGYFEDVNFDKGEAIHIALTHVEEIEGSTLNQLKGRNWKVHRTVLLRMLIAVPEKSLIRVTNRDDIVERFKSIVLWVRKRCHEELKAKQQQLREHCSHTVAPSTAVFMKAFIAKQEKMTSMGRQNGRKRNQRALAEYEELCERFYDFLKDVDHAFKWDADTTTFLNEIEEATRNELVVARTEVAEFWADEEKQVADAAMTQEAAAKKAKEEAQAAQSELAEEKFELERLLIKAEIEKSEAERVKAAAEKRLNEMKEEKIKLFDERAALEKEKAQLHSKLEGVEEENRRLKRTDRMKSHDLSAVESAEAPSPIEKQKSAASIG